jgi:predicted helicase
MLHHPGYRAKFAENLKRELPRIPLAGAPPADAVGKKAGRMPALQDFRAFADAGRELADWHLNYDRVSGLGSRVSDETPHARHPRPQTPDPRPGDQYPLKWVETPGVPLSYRVEKMKLTKDKTAVIVNESLRLEGIPPEVFEYRLGNRSALEWVIDQYQVSTDKRSGITSDPNRPDDEQYIVRLVGQVVQVSVETVRIVKSLPKEYGAGLKS